MYFNCQMSHEYAGINMFGIYIYLESNKNNETVETVRTYYLKHAAMSIIIDTYKKFLSIIWNFIDKNYMLVWTTLLLYYILFNDMNWYSITYNCAWNKALM